MKIRFKYYIDGPKSATVDPTDYEHVESIDDLRHELCSEMEDRVTWGAEPHHDDLDALWAEIQKLRSRGDQG